MLILVICKTQLVVEQQTAAERAYCQLRWLDRLFLIQMCCLHQLIAMLNHALVVFLFLSEDLPL